MLDKKSENVLKIAISKYDGDMDKDINIYGRDVELTFSELNSLCFNLYNSGYISNFFIHTEKTKLSKSCCRITD